MEYNICVYISVYVTITTWIHIMSFSFLLLAALSYAILLLLMHQHLLSRKIDSAPYEFGTLDV